MSEVLFSVSTEHARAMAIEQFNEIVKGGTFNSFENIEISMNPHNKHIQLKYQAISYCRIDEEDMSWTFNITVNPSLEIIYSEFEEC